MEDKLRVTMVATGLGGIGRHQQKPLSVVKTGTDASPLEVNYGDLEAPAVMRRRSRDAAVEAMKLSGVDMLDIPAFLRKQAD
jgi:cell division protein FtsZ